MMIFLILSICLVDATPEFGECGKCTIPAEPTFSGNKSYFFGTYTKLNWYSTYEHCSILGMEPVTIDSLNELKFLKKAITHHDYKNDFWTSGIKVNDMFRWMATGAVVDIDPNMWGPKQPGTNKDDVCLALSYKMDIKLRNSDCKNLLYFICEIRRCRTDYY